MSRRLGRLALGVLLALLGLVGAGCHQDTNAQLYSPDGPLYRTLDSAGERIVVRGPDDELRGKLRRRNHKFKVYGADLSPRGWVAWSEAGDEVDDGVRVTLRRLGESGTVGFRATDKDVYELAGHVRIERTSAGWAVYDRQGTLCGIAEQDETGWRLRQSYRDGRSWVVEADDEGRKVVDEESGRLLVRTNDVELDAVELLAFGFTKLDPLERTAVGVWLSQAMPGRRAQSP